jgi:hypothetical protein
MRQSGDAAATTSRCVSGKVASRRGDRPAIFFFFDELASWREGVAGKRSRRSPRLLP